MYQVFGPKAQQRSIYDQAISPIVKEVLDGFNCTVFAYGQTGTGKTYTMEGGMRNKVLSGSLTLHHSIFHINLFWSLNFVLSLMS